MKKFNILTLILIFIIVSGCMPALPSYVSNKELKEDVMPKNGLHTIDLGNAIKYDGYFKNGLYEGKGTLYLEDGTTIKGHFKEGNLTKAEVFYANGSYYNGSFSNNLPNGEGYLGFPNGDYFLGNFESGKANGDGQLYNAKSNKTSFGNFDSNFNISDVVFEVDNKNGNVQVKKYDNNGNNVIEDYNNNQAINKATNIIKQEVSQIEKNINAYNKEISQNKKEFKEKKNEFLETWNDISDGGKKSRIDQIIKIEYLAGDIFKTKLNHLTGKTGHCPSYSPILGYYDQVLDKMFLTSSIPSGAVEMNTHIIQTERYIIFRVQHRGYIVIIPEGVKSNPELEQEYRENCENYYKSNKNSILSFTKSKITPLVNTFNNGGNITESLNQLEKELYSINKTYYDKITLANKEKELVKASMSKKIEEEKKKIEAKQELKKQEIVRKSQEQKAHCKTDCAICGCNCPEETNTTSNGKKIYRVCKM